MTREAGKGDDRRKESAPGLHDSGYDAIDWSAQRTERQHDQDWIEAQRAANAEAAHR